MYLHSDDPPVTACSQRSPAGNEKQAADHLISRLGGTHLGFDELTATCNTVELSGAVILIVIPFIATRSF
jgi:hypothetical protein